LRQAGAVYLPWSSDGRAGGETIGPDEVLVRLVTSFATSDADIDRLLDVARRAPQPGAAE
jgi:threonine aldolase